MMRAEKKFFFSTYHFFQNENYFGYSGQRAIILVGAYKEAVKRAVGEFIEK
jgi:hypothetical protein